MMRLILSTDGANRRFNFEKSSQFFIRTHNVTLSIVAVRARSFAPPIQELRRSPNSNPASLRLLAMISQYFIGRERLLAYISSRHLRGFDRAIRVWEPVQSAHTSQLRV